MRNFIFLLLITSLSTTCRDKASTKVQYTMSCENGTSKQIRFTTLVNNISEYDSQKVEVEGVYKGRFEQSALFKNGWSNDITNALWISFGDSLKEQNSGVYLTSSQETFETINGKKIRIRGIVDSKMTGHLGKYRGGG